MLFASNLLKDLLGRVCGFLTTTIPRTGLHAASCLASRAPPPRLPGPAPCCPPPKWPRLQRPPAHIPPRMSPLSSVNTKSLFQALPGAARVRPALRNVPRGGEGLALKTLLQFADSWDLGGPGNSARGRKPLAWPGLPGGHPLLFSSGPHVTPVREPAAPGR